MLQWRYVAGNNWGTCENGTGAIGCGKQVLNDTVGSIIIEFSLQGKYLF